MDLELHVKGGMIINAQSEDPNLIGKTVKVKDYDVKTENQEVDEKELIISKKIKGE